ncbi:hypothetical protein H1R85_10785, partial [Flavobacterium psychrophilum]
MKNIFDYTYYRIAKFYYKRDGSDAITALLTITLIFSLYVIDILLFVFEVLNINIRIQASFIERCVIAVSLYIVYLPIKKRYSGKYFLLREKWIKETKYKKRLNGFLVILFILSPLI